MAKDLLTIKNGRMTLNSAKMNLLILVFALIAYDDSIGLGDFVDFHFTHGYRVTSQKIAASQEGSVAKCVILCRMSPECRIASYSVDLEQCFLSSSWYTDPMDFQIVEEPGAVLLRKLDPSSFYDDPNHWILAFRAHAKGTPNLWGSWTNTNHHDDDPSVYFNLPIGCVTVRNDLTCDRFYRSQLLDYWTKIDQVQIAFFKAGLKVAYVTFDARLSKDKNDFLHPDTIVATSITELDGGYYGTYNYFNVTGEHFTVDRRFYMSHSFNGCDDDWTWFVVVGGKVGCDWERDSAYPIFLYTESGSNENFHVTTPGRGDVFAVFIKRSA